ncbi:MAG: hypothetical protein Q8O83_04495 [bacterium]|nr:hypothetical protein [bacterium]
MEKRGPPESKVGNVIATMLFVVIVATFSYMFFFSGGSSSSQTPTVYTPDEIELHIQAQEFVKQGLKAPSTAKFPVLPYDTSADGNGLYKVDSYVDSQNSFGAMIRSDWTVLMRLSGETWTLERMAIGGKAVYDPVQAQKNLEKQQATQAEIDRLTSEIDQQLEYGRSLAQ